MCETDSLQNHPKPENAKTYFSEMKGKTESGFNNGKASILETNLKNASIGAHSAQPLSNLNKANCESSREGITWEFGIVLLVTVQNSHWKTH